MIEVDGILSKEDYMMIDGLWVSCPCIPNFIIKADIAEIINRPLSYNIMAVPFVINENEPQYVNITIDKNNPDFTEFDWDLIHSLKPLQSIEVICKGMGMARRQINLVKISAIHDKTINPVQYCNKCHSFIFMPSDQGQHVYQCCGHTDAMRSISHTPMKDYEYYTHANS